MSIPDSGEEGCGLCLGDVLCDDFPGDLGSDVPMQYQGFGRRCAWWPIGQVVGLQMRRRSMHGRYGAVVVVVGLAVATGAGVWVAQGGKGPAEHPGPAADVVVAPVAPEGESVQEPRMSPLQAFDTQPAGAEVAKGVAAAPPEEGSRRGRGRAEMLKRFDADGDGALNDEERALARQARRESRAAQGRQLMLRRFDSDGDGTLNDAETEIARTEIRAIREDIHSRIVPQYDLDGDGELNDDERRAARPAYQAEFERIRTEATLDLDGSGDIDEGELVRAIIAITEGDAEMDLNGDGETDYRDVTYATEIAQGGS